MKTFGARILSGLLLASFLYSHGDLFYAAARWGSAQKAGGDCVNASCCCDHGGPGAQKAVCGMCSAPAVTPNALPADQCCLYQANCDPSTKRPVFSLNKNLLVGSAAAKAFCFPNAEKLETQNLIPHPKGLKKPIFHPPQA